MAPATTNTTATDPMTQIHTGITEPILRFEPRLILDTILRLILGLILGLVLYTVARLVALTQLVSTTCVVCRWCVQTLPSLCLVLLAVLAL
ncbi:MAG: hypothetical protein B7X08_03190 [Acidocella sp. 20-63-7]|nr:MAG: hypothetical protein B7X08_03190 [Acidocella sp. 20-63-7]